MVRSRLCFLKHLAIALGALGLCVCSLEFALHLYDACMLSAEGAGARNACAPSWTVHHLFKPDVRVVTTNPDTRKEVFWRTNSIGLRGTEVDIPKRPGVYRIICLGDDSTLAAEMPQGEAFCDLLPKSLLPAGRMQIEVINAGCPQYGPLLSYLLLKHSLLALSPDLVVLNFDMSDVANDHRCRRYVRMSGEQPLYCPHPDLERQQSTAERFWLERLQMWRHAQRGLGYVLGHEDQPDDVRDIDSPIGTYAWLRDDAPDWSVYVGQTLGIIGQIAGLCRHSHCEFAISAVPSPWQISAEASNGPGVRARAGVQEHVVYNSRAPIGALEAFAKKQGIPFCDATADFLRTEGRERLFLKNAAHFSSTGHRLYARILSRFLTENVAGPWAEHSHEVGPRAMQTGWGEAR